MDAPQLLTLADYESLWDRLARAYAESGLLASYVEGSQVGVSTADVERVTAVGNVIFQFSVTYDLADEATLSRLSHFVDYIVHVHAKPEHRSAAILAAFLAVRDRFQVPPVSVH